MSLFKGTIYLTIATLLFMISGYAVNIFLTRWFGPEGYGKYGIVMSVIATITLIQTAGIPQAITKYIAAKNADQNALLKSGYTLTIISIALLILIYSILVPLFVQSFNDSTLTFYFYLGALVFPFWGFYALFIGYYNGLHEFKKQAYINNAYSIGKIVCVIIGAYFWGLSGAIVGYAISPLPSLCVGRVFPKFNSSVFPYKKLLVFSFPLIGASLLFTLLQTIDLYLVKAFLQSDTLTGYYAANQNIAKIPFYFTATISMILYPSISKLHDEENHTETQMMIQQSLRYSLLFLIPATAFLAVTTRQLIHLFYGDKFLPANVSLPIQLIAYAFLSLFSLLSNILNGSKKPTIPLTISCIGVCVLFAASYFFIPAFSLTGASYANVLSSFLVVGIAAYVVYAKFGTITSFTSGVKITVAALLGSAIIALLEPSYLLLPFAYAIGAIVYITLLFVLKEITLKDIELVNKCIPPWTKH